MTDEYTLSEFREVVAEMTAEPNSELGQDQIHESGRSHVTEIWQDGEMTSTKSGDLYGRRNLHRKLPPVLPEGVRLFDVGGSGNARRVVVDNALKEIMDNATFEISSNRYGPAVEVVVDETE